MFRHKNIQLMAFFLLIFLCVRPAVGGYIDIKGRNSFSYSPEKEENEKNGENEKNNENNCLEINITKMTNPENFLSDLRSASDAIANDYIRLTNSRFNLEEKAILGHCIYAIEAGTSTIPTDFTISEVCPLFSEGKPGFLITTSNAVRYLWLCIAHLHLKDQTRSCPAFTEKNETDLCHDLGIPYFQTGSIRGYSLMIDFYGNHRITRKVKENNWTACTDYNVFMINFLIPINETIWDEENLIVTLRGENNDSINLLYKKQQ
ncbi:hypothetical protein [Candidatus Sororendozoicomonas aggregata]|uniref:hypothetical protein n=1 Tax=Candidatus Sororendozoicomonas aggregata TaxID=3073239 RepID=UPI002ED0E526